ncbi:hypothetical protein [Asanoa siamensis]|uniref:Dolichyl-phosphate-mannose-protein mannosyltransferase n=1 Tax=Asanoa siamensis TaxID=926357 RepID=A0ABQ4CVU1_9ACTN|nr:hypothetical protein [Asanoa siamensis]GIF75407.1 hypothetical protein Asi02nite_49250 [Asanoa siamensis]
MEDTATREAVPVQATPASGDQPRGRLTRLGEWPFRVLLTVALGVGLVGATRVWWTALGMWKDEAAIANNLRRSFLQLAGHLTYDQVAPVGWLWLQKAMIEVVGPGDRVLRFLPFVGTLTVLCLGTLIARRAIGRFGAVAVALLLSFSPVLLVYAGETKQYAWEAGVALALIVLAAWAHDAIRWAGWPALRARPWLALAWIAATGVAVFVSFSAILVMFAVTAALVGLHALRRAWPDALFQAALSAPAALTAVFLVWWRHRFSFYPNQTDYFRGGTAPEGAGVREYLDWFPYMWSKFIEAPMSWRHGALVLALMVVGLVSLWLRSRLWAAMLLMVFLAAVGGGAVRGFPVVSRPAIYLIAPTVVLVVAAVDGLARASVALYRRGRAHPWQRIPAIAAALAAVAAAVGIGLVAGPSAGTARAEIAQPLGKEALRDALREVSDRVQPGDVVLVYYFGNAVTTWYKPYLNLGPDVHNVRLCQPDSPKSKQDELYAKLSGAKRVFYVEGMLNATTRRDNFAESLRALDAMGTIVEQHDRTNTRIGPHSWALVELTQVPPSPLPAGPDDPCLEMYQ